MKERDFGEQKARGALVGRQSSTVRIRNTGNTYILLTVDAEALDLFYDFLVESLDITYLVTQGLEVCVVHSSRSDTARERVCVSCKMQELYSCRW